ncbi:receptor-like protein kinase anxur2 [Fagus crenata]
MHTIILVCLYLLSNSFPLLYGLSDSLLLACGLIDGDAIDSYGRKWSPDSTYTNSSTTIRATFPYDPSLESPNIPHSIRFFTSETIYELPIKPDKRHMFRLHFSPIPYGNFDPEKSFFSVSANHLLLLKNFNPSFTCQALSKSYIIQEYSLAPLQTHSLSIIFTPSAGSFAFVNAMELFQMPDLYESATILGSSEVVVNENHFRTMFRLNVGGRTIPPPDDSGLTREWTDDTEFLTGAVGMLRNDIPTKIRFKRYPKPIAPRELYASSRYMSNYKRIALAFNLTWVFQVDPKSSYFIRLHFCDLFYRKPNEIAFKIYLNGKVAEPEADVIAWSGGKDVPTYRDYLIYLSELDQKISVALHPSSQSKPEYMDALLSGLELLKVTDSNGSLASLNPLRNNIHEEEEAVPDTKFKKSKTNYITWGACLGAAAIGIVTVVCVIVYQQKKRVNGTKPDY